MFKKVDFHDFPTRSYHNGVPVTIWSTGFWLSSRPDSPLVGHATHHQSRFPLKEHSKTSRKHRFWPLRPSPTPHKSWRITQNFWIFGNFGDNIPLSHTVRLAEYPPGARLGADFGDIRGPTRRSRDNVMVHITNRDSL